ncbi:hypothetical protein AAT18_00300 [Rhodococcus aetherivorans]|nr:hypothetical protein AAT18_00300 [Rhodococcus aetherivorans]
MNAAADATFTMCPPVPRSSIWSPNARHPYTTPQKLTSMTCSNVSCGVPVKVPITAMPALLTSTSGTPCWERTVAANRRTCSSSATSSSYACAPPPYTAREPPAWGSGVLSISAVSRAVSRLRSATTTIAPTSEKARAVARPMPLPAPVTTASVPVRSCRR